MSTSKNEPEQAGIAILIYDKIEFKAKRQKDLRGK